MKLWISTVFASLLVLVSACALAADKPLLAIMPIQDEQKVFTPEIDEAATSYLRRRLEVSGAFIVVDKSRQEETLIQSLKKESYDVCADERCQIDLGHALSADTLLKSAITKLGKLCTFTATLVDLEREAAVGGGESYFDCTEDGLRTALDTVVEKLVDSQDEGGSVAQVEPAPQAEPTPQPSPTPDDLFLPGPRLANSDRARRYATSAREPIYKLTPEQLEKIEREIGLNLNSAYWTWVKSGQHEDFLKFAYSRNRSAFVGGVTLVVLGGLSSLGLIAYAAPDQSDTKVITAKVFGWIGVGSVGLGSIIAAVGGTRSDKIYDYILRVESGQLPKDRGSSIKISIGPTGDGEGGMVLLGGRF